MGSGSCPSPRIPPGPHSSSFLLDKLGSLFRADLPAEVHARRTGEFAASDLDGSRELFEPPDDQIDEHCGDWLTAFVREHAHTGINVMR
jgi:hypothetical protein